MKNLIQALVSLAQRAFQRTPEPELAASDVLRDMLLLTGDDDAYGVSVDEIDGWTAADRLAVEEWATMVHLRASDHDDLPLPAVPEVIRQRHAESWARRAEGA